jgi:hypothetical protein
MRNLTLFIPGLLGPDTHYSDDFTPKLDALELLLARSNHSQDLSVSLYRSLCEHAGIALEPERDVPVAAISRLIDDHETPEGIWMRADPVHLRPDRDGLVLMDSFILGLSQHDALAIAAEVNKVLAVHGWTVEVPYEDRWYIRMDATPDLITTELPAVVGRDIRRQLPRGEDAQKFHALLNEIQMQLYTCDLNQLRESRGELPVNSVWFWGLGTLPDEMQWQWSRVFSEDVFVRGLARSTATTCHAVPPNLESVVDVGGQKDKVLVVLQHCQAPAQYQNLLLWHQALEVLEQSWFRPALELLQRGQLHSLDIIGDGHRFTLNWLGLKRFWRKPQPLGSYRKA